MKMYICRILKLFPVALFLFWFSGATVLAQSEQGLPGFCPPLIDEIAYNEADVEERMKIKICQWLGTTAKGRQFNSRANKQGENALYIGIASSQYAPDQERSNWAASRSLTYTDAYLDLVTEFAIQESGQNIRSEAEKRGFGQRGLGADDLLCYPNEVESEWYERVLRKSGAVLEGKLDKALIELDVDPENFDNSSKRRNLARRIEAYVSSLSTSSERSVGPTKVAGLVIIKTFEEVDGSESTIGILARWSDQVNTMTRLMDDNNGNLPLDYPRGGTGKTVEQWINETKKDLDHTFGVRIMRDENGYPLLLAFGHSANRYFGANRQKKKQDKQFSLDVAEENAYSLLADYVAGNVQFAKTTHKDIQNFNGYELFDEQGKCVVEEVLRKSFRESIEQTWSSSAQLVDFKGALQKYSGIVRHPLVEDVQLSVSVVAWSPEISTKPEPVEKEPEVKKNSSGSLSSPALGDPNDF